MKVEDLLTIPPETLAAMTDEQLATTLGPLIPPARAAYIGPRTGTIMVGDRKVQRRSYQNKEKLLATLLAQKGINL